MRYFQDDRPLPPKQRRAQQHNIAGLRVGEYLAPAAVGIRVLKAAGKNDENCRPKTVGHLTPEGLKAPHEPSSFPAE